jgi:hypothetical protein
MPGLDSNSRREVTPPSTVTPVIWNSFSGSYKNAYQPKSSGKQYVRAYLVGYSRRNFVYLEFIGGVGSVRFKLTLLS